MQPDWHNWLERLYNLRRDKSGQHERPHKPVLLLSIMDLLDRGLIEENKVALSEELVRAFRRYFEVLRQGDDQPTIQNPFFHSTTTPARLAEYGSCSTAIFRWWKRRTLSLSASHGTTGRRMGWRFAPITTGRWIGT